MAMDWASASFTRSGSTTTIPSPLFWRYCEIMLAAACGSSVAPPLAMDRYMAGCSGWLSDMQPASARSADMARIARIFKDYPRGRSAVVAYQQWLKSERRGHFCVIPGRCEASNYGAPLAPPRISRFPDARLRVCGLVLRTIPE